MLSSIHIKLNIQGWYLPIKEKKGKKRGMRIWIKKEDEKKMWKNSKLQKKKKGTIENNNKESMKGKKYGEN